jgi:RNA polymerase sigma-70 factor (ECF subfamily)
MSEPSHPSDPAFQPQTTQDLIRKVQDGDRLALDDLCRRYLRPLQRWARNRLPSRARDLLDTEDLVQDTLLKTVRNIEAFDPGRSGGLHAYLRMALDNRIRDEFKRAHRAPAVEEIGPDRPAPGPSALQEALGEEALARYERALQRLDPLVRETVIARVEFGLSYREIADALGDATPDAPRMRVTRALARMASEVGDDA